MHQGTYAPRAPGTMHPGTQAPRDPDTQAGKVFSTRAETSRVASEPQPWHRGTLRGLSSDRPSSLPSVWTGARQQQLPQVSGRQVPPRGQVVGSLGTHPCAGTDPPRIQVTDTRADTCAGSRVPSGAFSRCRRCREPCQGLGGRSSEADTLTRKHSVLSAALAVRQGAGASGPVLAPGF